MKHIYPHDLESSIDYVYHLDQQLKIKYGNKSFDHLISSAKQLHQFFSKSICISKSNTVQPLTLHDVQANPPTSIVIMGNNDLHHVEHIASLYYSINSQYRPKIYISGMGGHGTTAGYIFGKTEAETFSQRLHELGIPADAITLDCHATNTGENVRNISNLMLVDYFISHDELKIDANKSQLKLLKNSLQLNNLTQTDSILLNQLYSYANKHHIIPEQRILISGTPAALFRQLSCFEKKSPLILSDIMTIAPSFEKIQKHYYEDYHATLINFFGMLREAASYLYFYARSDYLSNKTLADDEIRSAIECLVDYYHLLSRRHINPEKLSNQYIEFANLKKQGLMDKSGPDSELTKNITEIGTFFRELFTRVEQRWMPQLPQDIDIQDQAEKLNPRYKRLGLEHGFFSRSKKIHGPSLDEKRSPNPILF